MQLLAQLATTSGELKQLVVTNAAATAEGLSPEELSKAVASVPAVAAAVHSSGTEGSDFGQTVAEYLQLWLSLGSLYYLDLAIKRALVSVSI
jgi:hypothetical protein